ncbi:RNA polymerase subunit sigma, partial [candidate division WOR-3 bacterium]|nr:RNA polymerase subunit sigma [candidate division WOR-3 bacterium]
MPRFNDETLSIYMKEIQKYPLLTEEEEKELARRAREGDKEARDKLVQSNLRFVVSVAKAYQNLGTPLSDLINEGNLGLVKAAERYDERK